MLERQDKRRGETGGRVWRVVMVGGGRRIREVLDEGRKMEGGRDGERERQRCVCLRERIRRCGRLSEEGDGGERGGGNGT